VNQRDKELVVAAAKARNLASLMNRTKWCELADVLEPFDEDVVPHYIDLVDPGNSRDFFGWDYARSEISAFILDCIIHPVRREHLGSLIPDRVHDRTAEVEHRLRALRLPFSRSGEDFVVHGYVDPSHQPDFVSFE
jgi:hypothetical protein